MAKSVLVVDDEKNIVLALEFLMEQAGFEVRVAYDGDAGLRAAIEEVPDLVLLGGAIPKRNGFDICHCLRSDSRFDKTRIILVTAWARGIDREKGLALGADDYITKPFSTRDLVERVHGVLDQAPGGPASAEPSAP